jgi:hypothetical protein
MEIGKIEIMCEAANFLKDVKDTSTSWDCSGSW